MRTTSGGGVGAASSITMTTRRLSLMSVFFWTSGATSRTQGAYG